jgi:hypothetical protein
MFFHLQTENRRAEHDLPERLVSVRGKRKWGKEMGE